MSSATVERITETILSDNPDLEVFAESVADLSMAELQDILGLIQDSATEA